MQGHGKERLKDQKIRNDFSLGKKQIKFLWPSQNMLTVYHHIISCLREQKYIQKDSCKTDVCKNVCIHQNQWGIFANVNKYFGLFTTLVSNYYFGCDEMVKEYLCTKLVNSNFVQTAKFEMQI